MCVIVLVGLVSIPIIIGVFKLWNAVDALGLKNEFKGLAFAALIWISSRAIEFVAHTEPPHHAAAIIEWFGYHVIIFSIVGYPAYLSYSTKEASDVRRSKSGEVKRVLPRHGKSTPKSRSPSTCSNGFTLGELLHNPDLNDQHEEFREYLARTCGIEAYLFYFAVCKFQEECSTSAVFPQYSVAEVLEDREPFGHQAFVGDIPGVCSSADGSAPDLALLQQDERQQQQQQSDEHSASSTSSPEISKNPSQQMRADLGLDFMNLPDEGETAVVLQELPASSAIISLATSTSNGRSADLLMICQWAVGLYCDFVEKSAKNRVRGCCRCFFVHLVAHYRLVVGGA